MNAARRKQLDAIFSLLEGAKGDLETIASEEQEYFDNMPENMQNGDKGERAQQAVSELEDAVNSLEGVLANVETAKE